MQIKHTLRLSSALNQAARTAQDLRSQGTEAQAVAIETLIERANGERFVIAIAGSAKRGKSTLINGMLGRTDDTLAPVGKFPATNVVSIFSRADTMSVQVRFQNGTTQAISEGEIREYACEDRNPNNGKNVDRIEVVGPFVGLERGVCLVDLPGTDNAFAEQHAKILFQFLPSADAIIFLATAEEPINAAEQQLLRRIQGHELRKLFFVVNKIDLVRSGDLDEADLAQGIEHDRRILADVGFSDTRVHQISAKDFLQGKPQSGVESLLESIRATIASDRLELIADRLETGVRTVLSQANIQAALALTQAGATREQLEAERTELEQTRRGLQRGQSRRETAFKAQWDDALAKLEDIARKTKKDVTTQYSAVIDKANDADLSMLLQTIHFDVNLVMKERLDAPIDECNTSLEKAQAALASEVTPTMLRLTAGSAEGSSQVTSSGTSLKRAAEIGLSAAPAAALGIATVALPGIVGSVIGAMAPAAVAATLNPFTWFPAAVSAGVGTVVGGAQLVAVTALSAVALPLTGVIFCYAGYKAYSGWRVAHSRDRNDLKASVRTMIEEQTETLLTLISTRRRAASQILIEFDRTIENSIDAADARLVELTKRPVTQEEIHQLGVIASGFDKSLAIWSRPTSNASTSNAAQFAASSGGARQ